MAEAAGVGLQIDAAEPLLEPGALAEVRGPVAAAARAVADRTRPGGDRPGRRDLPAGAAAAVSGLLTGVDPLDRPGVERYERERFRPLGRP